MKTPTTIKDLRAYLRSFGLFPRAVKGGDAIRVNIKYCPEIADRIHEEIAGFKWSVCEMDDAIEIRPSKHTGLVYAASGWQQRIAATNCKSL